MRGPFPFAAQEEASVQTRSALHPHSALRQTMRLPCHAQPELSRLNKTLNRFPKIHYAPLAALERIAEISQMESTLRQQVRQNHEFMNRLAESRMDSGAWPQNTANQ